MTTEGSASRRGRKPAASRAILEEAAGELFLEQGYAATTIEQIAQRAGVSRNTFFNYFAAKSDLLWSEVNASADWLREELAARSAEEPPLDAVCAAFEGAASRFGPARLPLAATQFEAMGIAGELQAAAVPRFARLVGVVEAFLVSRGLDTTTARTIAFASVAAAVAAAAAWAGAGVGRGSLAPYVLAAVEPVCRGFASDGER